MTGEQNENQTYRQGHPPSIYLPHTTMAAEYIFAEQQVIPRQITVVLELWDGEPSRSKIAMPRCRSLALPAWKMTGEALQPPIKVS
jgi:hypothetical protein